MFLREERIATESGSSNCAWKTFCDLVGVEKKARTKDVEVRDQELEQLLAAA